MRVPVTRRECLRYLPWQDLHIALEQSGVRDKGQQAESPIPLMWLPGRAPFTPLLPRLEEDRVTAISNGATASRALRQ